MKVIIIMMVCSCTKLEKTLHMSQYVYATQTLVIYKLVKQIIDIEAL